MKTQEEHIARGQLILAQFMDPEKDAVQYGVPGMKWGKRKALEFVEDAQETAEIATMLGGGGGEELSEEEKAKKLAEYLAKQNGIDLGKLSAESFENFMNFVNDSMKNIGEGVEGVGKFLKDVGKNIDRALNPPKQIKDSVQSPLHRRNPFLDGTVTSIRGADGKIIEVPGLNKQQQLRNEARRDFNKAAKKAIEEYRAEQKKKPWIDQIFHSDIERGELILAQLMDPEKDLVQYGVPGMKWGKRKASGSRSASPARPPSPDHIEARQLNKKKLHELSNDELQKLTKRLDLEAKYRKTHPTRMQKAQKVLKQVVAGVEGANKVYKMVQNTEQGKKAIAQGQAAIKAARTR